MKKRLALVSCVFVLASVLFGQTNNTIDIDDEVYDVLKIAEIKGYCSTLSNVKPYTEKYILQKFDEIELNLNNVDSDVSGYELEVIAQLRKRFKHENGADWLNFNFRTENEKASVPISLELDLSMEGLASGGLYSNKSNNSFGYEVWGNLDIRGDLGKYVSYKTLAFVEITKMPLTQLGTYDIGYWWYDYYGLKNNFNRAEHLSDRTINTFRNYAVLPYNYKKHWDGSVYYLDGGINSNGLTGWPFESSLAFGMQGELHGSFFDDLLNIGIGRYNREWGAMDNGSSLVFNANAHPFFGVDASVRLFDWLSFSAVTGFLEFPNQNYINQNAWYPTDGQGNKIYEKYTEEAEEQITVKDSFYFHNLFAMAMLDADFKYLHFDFGSTVIYPNRFELGYSFPLVDRVVYQNNVGDYDNLSLYANLKLRYPKIGYVWGSVYIDEINAFKTDFLHNTRCMFAYQGGTRVNIPWLPFASVSFRYTKIEPYCYTHEALDSVTEQPYFSHYISENYTNNGESLGYYLPPNSDEFRFTIDTNPFAASSFSFRYQLIRHGVDWGRESNVYSGSSIYSELPAGKYGPGRNNLHKYFLHDGVYEWMNVFAIDASFDLKKYKIPLKLFGSIGYVHNWFTSIGNETPSSKTKYYKYTSDEYTNNKGVIISIGFKAFTL